MPTFKWDVLVPGKDLPHPLTTDYILSEGEEITVDGAAWIVERVDIDDSIQEANGIVSVTPANDSAA